MGARKAFCSVNSLLGDQLDLTYSWEDKRIHQPTRGMEARKQTGVSHRGVTAGGLKNDGDESEESRTQLHIHSHKEDSSTSLQIYNSKLEIWIKLIFFASKMAAMMIAIQLPDVHHHDDHSSKQPFLSLGSLYHVLGSL